MSWSPVLVGLAVVLVQVLTLTPGHEWYSDDYAAYVHNAAALATGGPYALPGYTPDLRIDAGPGAYPPGFPLLLLPVAALFGTALTPILAYNLLFAGALSALFVSWLRPVTGKWPAVAAGLLVGLSPFVSGMKGLLHSEFACMALLLAWLLLDRAVREGHLAAGGRALAGLALGAAVLTRLVVAPAIAAAWLGGLRWGDWRRADQLRALTVPAVGMVLVVIGLVAVTPELVAHYWENVTANAQVKGSGGSGLLARLPELVMDNLRRLPGQITVIWSFGGIGEQPPLAPALDLLRKGTTLLLLLAGFAGLLHRLARGPQAAEWFFLLQLGALLALPAMMTAPRLYVMHALLLIYYAFVAVAARPVGRWAVLAVLLAASVPGWVQLADARDDPYSVSDTRSAAVLDWLRQEMPADALILARRARAVVFFTGRPATDWPAEQADAAFIAWARERGATHILFHAYQSDVLKRVPPGDRRDPLRLGDALDASIAAFFAPAPGLARMVFRNERFRVFALDLPKP